MANIEWKNDSSGFWGTGTNWVGDTVPGTFDTALFSNVTSAGRTIFIDEDVSLTSIDTTGGADDLVLSNNDGFNITCSGDFKMKEVSQQFSHRAGMLLTVGGTLCQFHEMTTGGGTDAGALRLNNAAPTVRYRTGSSFSPKFEYFQIADGSTVTLRPLATAVGEDFTAIDNIRVTNNGSATITFDTTDVSTNLGIETQASFGVVDVLGTLTINGITHFEHESFGSSTSTRVSGDDRVSITWGAGTTVYDLTGAFNSPARTFVLNSDITGSTSMRVRIQKWCNFDLAGYDITNCEDIRVGDSNGKTCQMLCREGSVTASGELRLVGTNDSLFHAGSGTHTIGDYIEFDDGGTINGYAGGSITCGGTTPIGTADVFVKPDGDNLNDGRDDANAVQTIARAMELANGTDTVVLKAGGTYALTNTTMALQNIGKYDSGDDPIVQVDHNTAITFTTAGSRFYESKIEWVIPNGEPIYAGITASRTSGVAPLVVHFDAIGPGGTTASTLSTPYHQPLAIGELDFSWSFGDMSSPAWENNYGGDQNSDTSPQTAHCFQSPGNYTVTLMVKDANGNQKNATVDITVNDITLEAGYTGYLLDAGGAGDYTTWDAAIPAVETAAATGPVRLLVTAGDSFTTTGLTIEETANPVRIIKTGTGADPIVASATDSAPGFLFEECSDQLIQGVDFNGTGATSTAIGVGTRFGFSDQNDHCYLYKCTIRNFDNGYENTGNIDMSYMGLIDCIIQNTLTYGIYTNYATNFTVMATKFLNVCRGTGGAPEHPLRCAWSRSNTAYCTFDTAQNGSEGPAGTVIKDRGWHKYTDVRPDPTNVFNCFHHNSVVIGEEVPADDINDFAVIGPSTSSGDVEEWVEYNLFEHNFIKAAHTPNQDNRIFMLQGGFNIVRNNIIVIEQTTETCYLSVIQQRSSTNPVPNNCQIYNNTMYIGAARGAGLDNRMIRCDDGTGHIAYNNIIAYVDGQTEGLGYTLSGAGITGSANAVIAGTTDCNAAFTDPANDDFTLQENAQGRVAANPTASTGEDDLALNGTIVAGLFRDFADVSRPLSPTLPDIGAHQYVAGPPAGNGGITMNPALLWLLMDEG